MPLHKPEPLPWTLHVQELPLLKSKLKEEHAALAGEMSGHMFFADRYYGFDDAIYASFRLLEIISREGKGIGALLADLPKSRFTPEMFGRDDATLPLVRTSLLAVALAGLCATAGAAQDSSGRVPIIARGAHFPRLTWTTVEWSGYPRFFQIRL